MMNVNVVDYYVGDVLESDATSAGYVDVGAATIEGFEAVENEFFGELDVHVGWKDDP